MMQEIKKLHFLRQGIMLTIAGSGLAVISWMRWVDPRLYNWGASLDEQTDLLPGDDWVTRVGNIRTRAMTINAPPQNVWPWLLQLGVGRGGFYTFDWIEKLRTKDKTAMKQLQSQLQTLQLGDKVELAKGLGLQVVGLEAEHFLVLGSPDPEPHAWSWAFVLEAVSPNATRLRVRERYGKVESLPLRLLNRLVSSLDNLMTWKMLQGIKARVENQVR